MDNNAANKTALVIQEILNVIKPQNRQTGALLMFEIQYN